MIKRELKMLVVGDKVKYTGKGDNQGYTGTVKIIFDDGSVQVYDGANSYCEASYKFWKFLSH